MPQVKRKKMVPVISAARSAAVSNRRPVSSISTAFPQTHELARTHTSCPLVIPPDEATMVSQHSPLVHTPVYTVTQGKATTVGEVGLSTVTHTPLPPSASELPPLCHTPDIYSACFTAALEEEMAEMEMTSQFRTSIGKLTSSFALLRLEGLKESLTLLTDLTCRATLEARAASDAPPSEPILPYDAIRVEAMRCVVDEKVSGKASGPRRYGMSNSWERAQRALQTADLTSAVFHYILVPSMEVRTRMNIGMVVQAELTFEEALHWTTTAMRPTDDHPPSLTKKLTAVTYAEQELACRLLQGLCLTVYHQRRCAADGCLMHYATEVFQCCLQHVEAVMQQKRQQMTCQRRDVPPTSSGPAITVGEVPIQGKQGIRELQHDLEHPVVLDEGLQAVIVALIDTVEAACHYSPYGLTRLAQSGGVRALLNLAHSPYVPTDVRVAVLDTISVLMQQVAPFRRAVVGGGVGGAPSSVAVQGDDDPLLRVMVQNAIKGTMDVRSGPLPYTMDRASASKFDSAVREWFGQHGLSHVVSGVIDLRNLAGMPLPASAPNGAVMRAVQRAAQLRERHITTILQTIDGHSDMTQRRFLRSELHAVDACLRLLRRLHDQDMMSYSQLSYLIEKIHNPLYAACPSSQRHCFPSAVATTGRVGHSEAQHPQVRKGPPATGASHPAPPALNPTQYWQLFANLPTLFNTQTALIQLLEETILHLTVLLERLTEAATTKGGTSPPQFVCNDVSGGPPCVLPTSTVHHPAVACSNESTDDRDELCHLPAPLPPRPSFTEAGGNSASHVLSCGADGDYAELGKILTHFFCSPMMQHYMMEHMMYTLHYHRHSAPMVLHLSQLWRWSVGKGTARGSLASDPNASFSQLHEHDRSTLEQRGHFLTFLYHALGDSGVPIDERVSVTSLPELATCRVETGSTPTLSATEVDSTGMRTSGGVTSRHRSNNRSAQHCLAPIPPGWRGFDTLLLLLATPLITLRRYQHVARCIVDAGVLCELARSQLLIGFVSVAELRLSEENTLLIDDLARQDAARLMELIDGASDEDIHAAHVLVHNGRLAKRFRRGRHERLVLLFDDRLCYVEELSNGRLRLRGSFGLDSIKVHDVPGTTHSGGMENRFDIVTSESKQYCFFASSPEQKRQWVDALRNTIRAYNRRRATRPASPTAKPQVAALHVKPLRSSVSILSANSRLRRQQRKDWMDSTRHDAPCVAPGNSVTGTSLCASLQLRESPAVSVDDSRSASFAHLSGSRLGEQGCSPLPHPWPSTAHRRLRSQERQSSIQGGSTMSPLESHRSPFCAHSPPAGISRPSTPLSLRQHPSIAQETLVFDEDMSPPHRRRQLLSRTVSERVEVSCARTSSAPPTAHSPKPYHNEGDETMEGDTDMKKLSRDQEQLSRSVSARSLADDESSDSHNRTRLSSHGSGVDSHVTATHINGSLTDEEDEVTAPVTAFDRTGRCYSSGSLAVENPSSMKGNAIQCSNKSSESMLPQLPDRTPMYVDPYNNYVSLSSSSANIVFGVSQGNVAPLHSQNVLTMLLSPKMEEGSSPTAPPESSHAVET